MIDKELYETIKKVMPVPTTCVIVLSGDEVLLCKRKMEPNSGYWSTPGGHIELGEFPNQTAKRELREETGLDIDLVEFNELRTVAYFHPGRQDIAVVFWVNAEKTQAITLNEEASEFSWFNVRDLPKEMLDQSRAIVKDAWEVCRGI